MKTISIHAAASDAASAALRDKANSLAEDLVRKARDRAAALPELAPYVGYTTGEVEAIKASINGLINAAAQLDGIEQRDWLAMVMSDAEETVAREDAKV